jgi:hypothetical protein
MEFLGPHLYARFPVRRYETASIAWLNDRWFLEEGVDILRGEVRREVSAWILKTFGVSASDTGSSGHVVDYLSADRYGGSKGLRHGGSGRCGAYGGFNAKGVGRTPLAAANVDWEHNHGRLWMSEAVREAINAEVANAELPYGAVPVVAIIDTGVDFQRDSDSPVERCAIVVRPNFVRPAHFERSVLFGRAGAENSEQYIDGLRVREAISAVTANSPQAREANIFFDSAEQMFARFSRQLGYGRAHRLWQGQFLSSNLSVDGALADFGSFRSVQNWQQAMGMTGQFFGNDRGPFDQFIESMFFYFRKYGGERFGGRSLTQLKQRSAVALSAGFGEACLSALPITPAEDTAAAAEISVLLQHYFDTQQKSRFQLRRDNRKDWRRPWLYNYIGPSIGLDDGTWDARVAIEVSRLVLSFTRRAGMKDRTALSALSRWLCPRPHLYYEIADPRSVAFCRRAVKEGVLNPQTVGRYIDKCVSRSRRLWPEAPRTLNVFAQTCESGSSALYGHDDRTDDLRVWVQGQALGSDFVAFGQKAPRDIATPLSGAGNCRAGVLAHIRAADERGLLVHSDGVEFRVPYPVYSYQHANRGSVDHFRQHALLSAS